MELTQSLWVWPGVTYLPDIQGRVYAEGSIHEDVGPQELRKGGNIQWAMLFTGKGIKKKNHL